MDFSPRGFKRPSKKNGLGLKQTVKALQREERAQRGKGSQMFTVSVHFPYSFVAGVIITPKLNTVYVLLDIVAKGETRLSDGHAKRPNEWST